MEAASVPSGGGAQAATAWADAVIFQAGRDIVQLTVVVHALKKC